MRLIFYHLASLTNLFFIQENWIIEMNEFIPSGQEQHNLIKLLEEKNANLQERERDLADKTEELLAQKEELTAAIEALMSRNQSLNEALEQLRDRNFELDQILYRTSHDLRSPISSIKGILSLLKLESQSQTIKNYGSHIENKVDQMDNLLRSLSFLSKAILEDPVMSSVQLEGVIRQVLEELKHIPSWGNVEVGIHLELTQINTDPYLMIIIFHSLLSNAFIFRDPLKKGFISVHSAKENDNIIFDVIDDGEGIMPVVADHIFEMFYRGSERSIGNGLGLYVARKAAERLKGTIIWNLQETNTRFQVMLPLR